MKRKILFAILSLSIIILGLTTITFAKYEANEEDFVVYAPQEYYFESDFLTIDNTSYTLQAGIDTITVSLNNYIDELNVSETDILYTIYIEKEGVELTNLSSSGKLTVAEKNEKIHFTGLTAGSYKIVATSTYPYNKTLSAMFIIPDLNVNIEINFNDESNSNFIEIEIVNNDYIGDVTINWVEGLVPNTIKPIMENFGGVSHTITFSNKNSSIVLSFLKTNPSLAYSASITNNVINITQTV